MKPCMLVCEMTLSLSLKTPALAGHDAVHVGVCNDPFIVTENTSTRGT